MTIPRQVPDPFKTPSPRRRVSLVSRAQNFLLPPDGYSPERKRFFSLATIAFGLCIAVHLTYIPIFLWMDVKPMALHSAVAIPYWVFLIWVARRGLIPVAYGFATFEFCAFIALSSQYIGWEAGAQYTIFAPAMMIFLFDYNRLAKAAYALIMSLAVMALYFFAEPVVWAGNPAAFDALWAYNCSLAFIGVFLTAGYMENLVARAEDAMHKAHAVSEALLNNVMPPVIAERLKQKEAVIADRFHASILFADIVGFTQLSARLSPDEVVLLLDDLFSRIDVLVRKYGLEKIKTIGDAYMVAAGLPTPRPDHAEALARFAFELQDLVRAYNAETGRDIHIRVGLNSGPVVAGVIGKLRFLYDMWGDSVNTASRMESHGVPDEIQVTESTRELLLGKYGFHDRGIIDVKGKGLMRAYLLRPLPVS